VTWNVSIAIRSLCITLLAAILALVLVVALAEDADARKVRRKKGIANPSGFSQTFHSDPNKLFEPPNAFDCSPGRPFKVPTAADWDPATIQPPKPIDGYICTAVGSVTVVENPFGDPVTQARKFDLDDVLDRAIGCPSSVDPACGPLAGRPDTFGPPPGPLATPDLLKCHLVPNAPLTSRGTPFRTPGNFSCEPDNQKNCVFTMNELVATNIDEVDANGRVVGAAPSAADPAGSLQVNLDENFLFLPVACHALPTAVPAGADAAGEGSAAWLFGLVLAASGALVGTVVIARRRFLHDS
jgi:hypothetical protein